MLNVSGRRWPPVVIDGGVAAVALATSLALAPGAARGQPGTRPLDGWAYALVVLACAALVARRRHPLPTAAVVGVALAAFAVRGYPGGPLVVAVMVALYAVGAGVGRRRALAVGAVAVVLVAARSVAVTLAQGHVSPYSWGAPGWVVACLLGGVLVRAQRQSLQAVRDRAEQAERTREEEARARVAEERLRIARELHDVVGHSFAAVNVQARAAGALLDNDSAGARRALAAIEATSREALHEIRAALSALRDDAPQPVTGVAELVAPVRAAGLDVHLGLDDALRLPPPVGHAVYRVVQESLTNVVRHAGATTVTITVAREGHDVRVEVRDDGRGASAPDGSEDRGASAPDSSEDRGASAPDGSDGRGLTGMRERVAALGGRLDAGPVAGGGGWRVAARIPAEGGNA